MKKHLYEKNLPKRFNIKSKNRRKKKILVIHRKWKSLNYRKKFMIKKMISNNKIKQIGWEILKKIKMSYSNKNNPNLQ